MCQILLRRAAHLSGDIIESSELPRRRAFSLSHGVSSGVTHSAIRCESPLMLKSSSVSSVASKHINESVHCDDSSEPIHGEFLLMPVI